jgi:hypothetical protein
MTVIISDESVNRYGYRILTSGIELKFYKKNPVLLYMHIRAGYENPELLPIGRVENIRKEAGQLLGDLVFDEDDEFALKVKKKFEKKFLNTVSLNIDPVEVTEDPQLMLPGQTLPTVSKCELMEVSIVDIPGNKNATRLTLRGKSVEPNELKSIFNKNQTSMKKIIAKLAAITALSLSDTATEDEVVLVIDKALNEGKTKDDKITQLTTKVTELETQLSNSAKDALKGKAEALVDGAETSGKIVKAEREGYLKLAAASEEGYTAVKSILDAKKGFTGLQLKDGNDPEVTETDREKDAAEWTKLHYAGKIAELKASDMAKYKRLYKAKYGKEPVS